MKKLLILTLFVIISGAIRAQIINTIAGNGTEGCSGDGEHALNAQFSAPMDIVTDASGNLYITDYNCQVIRKVNAAGIITTIAGTGVAGNSGDNGPAIDAQINHPKGIIIDIDGNIVFVYYGNQSVRRISLTTGIITLIASGLNGPLKLACGPSGHIYVANLNGVINKIDYTTGIVSTLYTSPANVLSVAVDGNDNVYFSTTSNLIYYYNQTSGISSLYAGGGGNPNGENIPALSVAINYPYDLDIDNQGNLIYLDSYNHRIRKIDRNTNLVSTIAGNGNGFYAGDGGPAINASFAYSEGIYVDHCNNLFLADYSADRIRKVTINYTPASTPSLAAQAICSGGMATIEISGSLNDATQWKLYSFGCGSIVEGTTSGNTITVTPAENTLYYVRGEGDCVSPGVCSNITIQVTNDPAFIAHPTGAFLCAGNTHTMSVSASGGTPELTYQWQYSTNATDWSDISVANQNSYTTPELASTTYYRCVVSAIGNGCNEIISNMATVNVTPVPENDLCINAIPVTSFPYTSELLNNNCSSSDIPPTSGCNGYSNNVWFMLSGTGNIMSVSTISQLTNLNTEIHIYTGECTHLDEVACNDDSGTGNQSYLEWCTLAEVDYFISVGSNDLIGENGSFIISISDYPLSVPEIINSSPITICPGGEISVSAIPGNNGNSVYWYSEECNNSIFVSGNTLTGIPVNDISYFAQTRNTLCPESASECSQIDIVVADALTFLQQPSDETVCAGGSCSLSVVAEGGTPSLTYQWQISADGISFEDILNAGAVEYYVSSINETKYFRCVITASGAGCGQQISEVATVMVLPDPVFTLQPSGAVICSGDFASLTVAASGGIPSLSYQWQISEDGYLWNNIDNEVESTYTTGIVTSTTYYRCVATTIGPGCNMAISNMAVINVTDLTAPAPENNELEIVYGECFVEITSQPVANDNCDGIILGVTENDLYYDVQGNYLIIWEYIDSYGNVSQQSQYVVVSDETGPVPNAEELEDVVGECSAEVSIVPQASDNCSGTIIATTQDPLLYESQGTFYITWVYNDGNGNTSYQVQTVVVEDVSLPEITCNGDAVVDAMPNHYYLISNNGFDPVSVSDNCLVESVENDFNNTNTLFGEFLPEGTNTITWTVTDIGGNT